MPNTTAIWADDTTPLDEFATLATNQTTDVCIIGGGIAGLTTAYRLLEAGRSIILVDAATPGAGETAYTTAHLSWAIDDRFERLASLRGDETARLAAESHQSAINDIERIITEHQINCDFARLDGYLFPGTDGSDAIESELEAVQRLGLEHTHVNEVPIVGTTGIRFPDQARFHPVKYINGLIRAIQGQGGEIYASTRVVKITGGHPCKVETESGITITAESVVIATNVPFDAGLTLHAKLAAYTTYAIAMPVPAGTVPDALYWDTDDPYHYLRIVPSDPQSPRDMLIVGGEDHKTGQADDQPERWERLAEWARLRIPDAGEIAYRWSGQVFETPDGLGLIGAAPWGENLYVITGDSGMGLTHGTLGGRLVAKLITGIETPLREVYDPNRWTPNASWTLIQENVNLAAQYADWLTGGDVSSVDQIPAGQGAIVRQGLTKIAVYRKPDGTVCEHSATCPHMGAVVRWNPGEKTWDCPAHGSRFKAEGEVMHGPAVSGLEPVEQQVEK